MTTCQIDCHLTYKIIQPTEIIFLIHAAYSPNQTILAEQLCISPTAAWHEFQDPVHHNRHIRLRAAPCESFEVYYQATVECHNIAVHPQSCGEVAIRDIPDAVLPYLLASRYCNSDQLENMAMRSFAWMEAGYARVKAIEQWIFNNIAYISGSSNQFTTATDTLIQRAGVCRDFAHLGIALCRALGIPARIVVGYVEIENFSPDFHAVFEAYLEGGWRLFDPTRLAPTENLIRIAAGVDAGDVAFATFYGDLKLLKIEPRINYKNE